MSIASEKTLSWMVIGARKRMTLPCTPQVKRIRPFSSAIRRTRFGEIGAWQIGLHVVELDRIHKARATDV